MSPSKAVAITHAVQRFLLQKACTASVGGAPPGLQRGPEHSMTSRDLQRGAVLSGAGRDAACGGRCGSPMRPPGCGCAGQRCRTAGRPGGAARRGGRRGGRARAGADEAGYPEPGRLPADRPGLHLEGAARLLLGGVCCRRERPFVRGFQRWQGLLSTCCGFAPRLVPQEADQISTPKSIDMFIIDIETHI